MYKLVIADDEGSKSTVPVIRDEITIGRQDGNTIRLTERNVSRRHARVVRTDGQMYVEDVAARYGIKKNGAKIDQRAQFEPGDVVTIGDYQLTLRAKTSEQDSSEPSPSKAARADDSRPDDAGTQVLPAMPAKVVVVSSNFAGQEFPLNKSEMVIGRGDDCDIIIDHRSVSQKHAKVIREQGNRYQIVDLNSKNGVTVGGEQYRAVHLKRGDVVALGHVKFRFVEPGENYVFTPQPAPAEADVGGADRSTSTGLIAAVLVIAVIAGGGIIFLMSDRQSAGPPPQKSTAKPLAHHPNSSATPPPTKPSQPTDRSTAPAEPSQDHNVEKLVAEAGKHIQAGQLDRAIKLLKKGNEQVDPSSAQRKKVAQLMDKAQSERPFKKKYGSARDDIQSQDFDEAVDRLAEIPETSVFYQMYRNQGLMKKSLDGTANLAKQALADNDTDAARSLANKVLAQQQNHEAAESILERLADRDAPRVAAAEQAVRDGRKPAPSPPKSPAQPAKRRQSADRGADSQHHASPKRDQVTSADAKELYHSAQKKIFKSDPRGAIGDCKKALEGGYKGCYRILAIAYKQTGNTGAACKNFDRYLSTHPGNASAVKRQMHQLDCQ